MVISEGIDIIHVNPDGTTTTIRSVGKNVSFGEGVVIYGQDANIGNGVKIEDGAIIEGRVIILSDTRIGIGAHIKTCTIIFERCWIKMAAVVELGCHIMNDCIIEDGVIVGEMSTICHGKRLCESVPANSFI